MLRQPIVGRCMRATRLCRHMRATQPGAIAIAAATPTYRIRRHFVIVCPACGYVAQPDVAARHSIEYRDTLSAQSKRKYLILIKPSAPMKTLPPARLGFLPALIFSSRWLQLPLYLGLIVAQGVYVFLFLKELWHLVTHASSFGELEIMLLVLGLIDVVMISNLLLMVIVGGYETFVSRLRLENHPDQPEWLSHVNASVLKVKLAMAIIGISSIHLLRTFIEAGSIGIENSRFTEAGVMWQTIIHVVFILSAIGIAYVDKLSTPVFHPEHATRDPLN